MKSKYTKVCLLVLVIVILFDIIFRIGYKPHIETVKLNFEGTPTYEFCNKGSLYLNHNVIEIRYKSNDLGDTESILTASLYCDVDETGTFREVEPIAAYTFQYSPGGTHYLELPYGNAQKKYKLCFETVNPAVKTAELEVTLDHVGNSQFTALVKRFD